MRRRSARCRKRRWPARRCSHSRICSASRARRSPARYRICAHLPIAPRDGHRSPLGALASRVIDYTPDIGDFGDTAAIIGGLDLVVTTDTSVAHVAGALGKPVWMLDRFNTCWRWRLEPGRSPWYPTMRIFRQRRFLDWSAPIAAVTAELAAAVR